MAENRSYLVLIQTRAVVTDQGGFEKQRVDRGQSLFPPCALWVGRWPVPLDDVVLSEPVDSRPFPLVGSKRLRLGFEKP